MRLCVPKGVLLLTLWVLAFCISFLRRTRDKRAVRAFHWLTIVHSLSDPHVRCRFCNMRLIIVQLCVIEHLPTLHLIVFLIIDY